MKKRWVCCFVILCMALSGCAGKQGAGISNAFPDSVVAPNRLPDNIALGSAGPDDPDLCPLQIRKNARAMSPAAAAPARGRDQRH